MSLSDWFVQRRASVGPLKQSRNGAESEDLWSSCQSCQVKISRQVLMANCSVCPSCGFHHQINSEERIALMVDPGTFELLDHDLEPGDALTFYDTRSYAERLLDNQRSTGLPDAVVTGLCCIKNYPVALGVMDFRFMAGTIGSVVGERLTRLIETATAKRLPVIIVCSSGGGRMQEGVFSLMQIAKISAALLHHRQAQLLYIPLLTHPTYGGATASFGMLGDLILAEPKALIGFAGRRVIEQTLRETLHRDFQTAEYLRDHGFVDLIVERRDVRRVFAELLRIHGYQQSC